LNGQNSHTIAIEEHKMRELTSELKEYELMEKESIVNSTKKQAVDEKQISHGERLLRLISNTFSLCYLVNVK